MSVIEIEHLTKDYGHGRGIFDVSFDVKKGETFGFLGPNGAGKTTTMRHLMGFSKPQKGSSSIDGMTCWQNADKIKNEVGYLPGEVAIPEGLTGTQFIEMMEGMYNVHNEARVKELLKTFQLDPNQNVKRMSIGEKRKIAVVTAFMSDSDILLLDEPTSGLDPVMQENFIEFVRNEKKNGKTVLLSSHIFSEVEALCDRIAIIKDGKIMSIVTAAEIKHGLRKTVEFSLGSKEEYDRFLSEPFEFKEKDTQRNFVSVFMEDAKINDFLKIITKYQVSDYLEIPVTLEDYFMHFYKSDKTFGGVVNGRHH